MDNYLKYYKLKQNDKILDLGASDGVFENGYLDQILATNSQVIVLEACKESINRIIKTRKEPNFKFLNCLIGDKEEISEFIETTQPYLNYKKSAKQVISMWGGHKEIRSVMMKTVTLDSLIITESYFNFVKCDIEGAEIEVFMNCNNLDKIYNGCIAGYHIVDGQQTYKTLEPFLKSRGFYTVLDPNTVNSYDEVLLYFSKDKF